MQEATDPFQAGAQTEGSATLPGGGDADAAQAAAQEQGAQDAVGSVVATCPAPCIVTGKTRAGEVPIRGCVVECEGRRLGITNAQGEVRGDLSACEGTAELKVIYGNDARRVKVEEFTIALSGIDMTARTATGGQARNFISKVQDVFGSGDGGFPGDLDFEDTYDGAALVSVGPPPTGTGTFVLIDVYMATISLETSYVNQNDAAESIGGTTKSGGVLCMPTSGEMLADYWEIERVTGADGGGETREPLTRRHIMQRAYDRNPGGFSLFTSNGAHWQNWANYRAAMQELADISDPDTYNVSDGPSGNARENIPGDYSDAIAVELGEGKPLVTSTYATGGHVMIAIGAVVKHDDEAEWLIFNDPNGTLAGPDSIYGTLDIQNPVGLRGRSTAAVMNAPGDVRAVQEVLTRTGHYQGRLGAPVDEADPNDPTIVAIRAFQRGGDGRVDPGGGTERRMNQRINDGTSSRYSNVENERNRNPGNPNRPNDRGRHVYYSSRTEGAGTRNTFQLKGEAWSCLIEPETALTKDEISARLNAGTAGR